MPNVAGGVDPIEFAKYPQGLVYSAVRRSEYLDEALALFSRLLAHKQKNATFNALTQGFRSNWSLHDDIVNPLGDRRGVLVTVYTFDLDKDILFYSDITQNLQIPLSCFRGNETGLLEKMQPCEPPYLRASEDSALPPPYWEPVITASPRSVSFVQRVLTDFNYLWRHILRREYSEHTFRQFATAILHIASLDIDIREEASRWLHTYERGPFVWIHSRPTWKARDEQILPRGRIKIVVDQSMEQARGLAEADANKCLTAESNRTLYLLLSVRHVALCEVGQNGFSKCTEPAALLNGIDNPSHESVLVLLHAIATEFPPASPTPMHEIPMIQGKEGKSKF